MSDYQKALDAAREASSRYQSWGEDGREHIEERGHVAAEALDDLLAAINAQQPVAFLYTLEYGGSAADRKASIYQLNYPFGVCGADYQRSNEDGVSYVRETLLYAAPPAPAVPDIVGLAHEVWAASQLAPEECIEDGVNRIATILAAAQAKGE